MRVLLELEEAGPPSVEGLRQAWRRVDERAPFFHSAVTLPVLERLTLKEKQLMLDPQVGGLSP